MKIAVIETGGKQYKVAVGDRIDIEKLGLENGSDVVFDKILLVADGEKVEVGDPYLKDAKVTGKLLENYRDKKKIVFKYHSKVRRRKKKGHRQEMTEVEITGIK
ncbi:MAG: 50S ribosomal protein L21 [Patescibacteria group bacterium]|nr:50S ribosomal protein L21 [Patescibacteria group bacterium]